MNTKKNKNILKNKYLILTIITIIAFFIRLLNIDKHDGLWYDEMLTYIYSSKNFPLGIIKILLKEDYHMPLYYLLAHVWMNVFGKSDVTLRLFSVFWGTLTIPALFYLGKTYKSDKLGYLIASIGCLSPALIYFSQEFRFYSLLTLLSTISITYFLKLLDNPSKANFSIFYIINLALIYTFTMGIAFVGLEVLVLTFNYFKLQRPSLGKMIKPTIVFTIFAIPYFILLAFYIYGSNQVFIDNFAWGTTSNLFPILIINDWFSPFLTTFYGHDYYLFNIFLSSPQTSLFLHFMIIPTFCFISGFIFSLKNINKKFCYLLVILFSFLLLEYLISLNGYFIILLKYTIFLLPIILLICSDGLISIKSKIIKSALISIIFIIYIFNTIDYRITRTFETRNGGLKMPVETLEQLKPDDDYLLMLERTELLKKYVKGYHFIDFDAHRAMHLDRSKSEDYKIFDRNFVETTNKHNSRKKLIPYFMDPNPTPQLTTYINNQVNSLPKGKRFIYIEGPFYGSESTIESISSCANNYANGLTKEKDYKDMIFFLFIEKIDLGIKSILQDNPSLIKIDEIKLRSDYFASPNIKYNIYVYKKI